MVLRVKPSNQNIQQNFSHFLSHSNGLGIREEESTRERRYYTSDTKSN